MALRPRRSPSSAPRSIAGAPRSRRRSAGSAFPTASRTRASYTDAVRSRPRLTAPLRMARRRAARALRLHALAVLGPPARARRLPRGSAARSRGQLAGESRGGDAPSARPAASVPRARSRRRDEPRRDRRAGRLHASCGSRCRRAARRRRGSQRPRGPRAARPTSRRADGVGGARRTVACRRARRPTVERATVTLRSSFGPGRVAVLDMLRARTRHYEVVFVVGLEEGTLPRRSTPPTLLDDDERLELEERQRGSRLTRPDPVARERYLFYTTCTRARRRLYLAREAATEDGSPRAPSPFWQDVTTLFSETDVERWTRRRSLGQVIWPVEVAPTERERARAVAGLGEAEREVAVAIARANGWERRLGRALGAFDRPTKLTHPTVLRELARSLDVRRHGARAVRRLLVDVAVRARRRPARDRRSRRCAAAGTGGAPGPVPVLLGPSEAVRHRPCRSRTSRRDACFLGECVAEALAGQALNRLDLEDVERFELEQGLLRDLGEFVRVRGRERAAARPAALRGVVRHGALRARAAGGLDLGGLSVSGKIDRIDLDPFSARGIVQDYKSGKTAHSAVQIESEIRAPDPPLHARAPRPASESSRSVASTGRSPGRAGARAASGRGPR